MKKLSIISRILVAFASGALIVVFFLPAWRIDLFAPQYPEGLTMNIWINGLTGDVEVINGLNHYIGMKHISKEMFPEFGFLPYVVGFFILLGMIVALTGNRKFLFAYLVLSVIGCGLAMYDFYQWTYDYGHNLDPTAPIQVPGLSYQPPLFGHKRLLNFDAYSFPDIGGWVVIGAGMLAFGVWATEWYRSRKNIRVKNMKSTIAAAACIALLVFASCNTKPEPFSTGKDACSFCKMTISDTRFGGELITSKGKIYKFDDLGCMLAYIKATSDINYSKTLVIDHNSPNTFLDADKASFVVDPLLKSPMGSNAAAFSTIDEAKKAGLPQLNSVTNWNDLPSKIQ